MAPILVCLAHYALCFMPVNSLSPPMTLPYKSLQKSICTKKVMRCADKGHSRASMHILKGSLTSGSGGAQLQRTLWIASSDTLMRDCALLPAATLLPPANSVLSRTVSTPASHLKPAHAQTPQPKLRQVWLSKASLLLVGAVFCGA